MLENFKENSEKNSYASKILTLSLLKYLVLGFTLTSLLMASSGVSLGSSLLLSLAIIVQLIPGALLWCWMSRDRRITSVEILGMGLAIGTLLALLSSQLFRDTPFGRFGWAIPFLVSAPVLTWQKFRGKNSEASWTSDLTIQQIMMNLFPAIFFGIIQLSVWWSWHPLKWQGWWKYHLDVPYFESYSNSLTLLGTTHSLMDPTLDTRYHWFAYAWVGSLTNFFNIDPFVVLTRLLPIVAMTMGAMVAYSWAQSMSIKKWTPALAALIVVVGPGLSVGSFVMLRSPSSAMSVGWSLAFSLLLFKIISGEAKGPITYLVFVLLSVGIVGGKATNTVIVGIAIFSLLVTSFSQVRETRKRIWQSGVFSIFVLILTFKLLIVASAGEPRLGFGLFLGWPGLFLTILPTTIGILGLIQNRKSIYNPLLVYAASMIVIGSLLSLFTHDRAGAQLYFLVHAGSICIVPSLIGFERFLYREKEVDILNLLKRTGKQLRLILSLMVVIAGVTTFTVWILFENSTSTLGNLGRTLAPVPLWILCALATLALGRLYLPQLGFNKKKLDLLLVTLISATCVSSGAGTLYSIFSGPLYSGSSGIVSYGQSTKSDPGSISYNYVLAGKWVQEHIEPKGVFFTNRQCIEIESAMTNCDGLWFYASAMSRRQFLIEGNAYSFKSPLKSSVRLKNQQLSIRFSLNPNEKDWQSLWAKGVRWGWIDRKASSRTDWGKYAQEVFANSDIAVIKLLEPEG